MNNFLRIFVATSALALVASGCTGGGPKLYKAEGTVTDNKVPVAGAQVTFAYDDGNFANGYTDAAGKFVLTYMNRPGGAAPGKCKVSITKRGGGTATAPAILDATPKSAAEQKAKQEAQKQQMEEFGKKQAELDAEGGNTDLTKGRLTLEIKANEDENNFLIDLQDFKT